MKFLGKLLLYFLAIFFPFTILFFRDKPAAGLVALFLQCIVIGWPVAIIWAFKNIKPEQASKKSEEAEPQHEQ